MGGEHRGYLHVTQIGEASGKLYGIVGDKCRGVDSGGFGVEELPQVVVGHHDGKISEFCPNARCYCAVSSRDGEVTPNMSLSIG